MRNRFLARDLERRARAHVGTNARWVAALDRWLAGRSARPPDIHRGVLLAILASPPPSPDLEEVSVLSEPDRTQAGQGTNAATRRGSQ